MIEPDFLSISELAIHWKVSERQIIEHGMHQRLPFMFLFRGLVFTPSQSFLTGHGAAAEQKEAEHLRESIASSEAHIRRNAAGKCDVFSAMDAHEVLQLRASINKSEERLEFLDGILEQREALRNKCEAFGYLRLPPRMIADLQQDGDIPFPYRAFAEDGQLMWLEPDRSGRWKERLTIAELLIPIRAVKAIDAGGAEMDAATSPNQTGELPKPVPRMKAQAAAILAEIVGLGHDPKALPARSPGKSGVRAQVSKAMKERPDLFSSNSFKKAWEELRASGEIADGTSGAQ